VRLFSRPVLASTGEAVAMVQAAHSLTSSDRLLERLRLLLAIVAGLGVPTTAIVGWVLAGRALAPIHSMTRELAEANARLGVANTRLERSLAVQQRFVADASHELRTPLTTIRANADVLRWTIGDDLDSDRSRALADLAGEAERLSRLLSGLLSLARVDAGQRVTLEPTPLKPLVEEAFRHAQTLARGQSVELAAIEDVDVRANADALRQLLVILVDNAIKYTPSDGRVSLAVRRAGDEARLSVTDTGVGISRPDADHIFERFYRADTAREIDGSGLGLAIARSIVEQHGGRLDVDSRPGQGSTFTVTLPAIRGSVTPNGGAPRPARRSAQIASSVHGE
jgi:signal transduction histidine kinase